MESFPRALRSAIRNFRVHFWASLSLLPTVRIRPQYRPVHVPIRANYVNIDASVRHSCFVITNTFVFKRTNQCRKPKTLLSTISQSSRLRIFLKLRCRACHHRCYSRRYPVQIIYTLAQTTVNLMYKVHTERIRVH